MDKILMSDQVTLISADHRPMYFLWKDIFDMCLSDMENSVWIQAKSDYQQDAANTVGALRAQLRDIIKQK